MKYTRGEPLGPGDACAPERMAMSVNAALDELGALSGKEVMVKGSLRFGAKATALDHSPKAQRRRASVDAPPEASSIWLYLDSDPVQFNEARLQMWDGRQVIVKGTLKKPAFHGGCGHFSAWPAEILVRSIGLA